MGRRPDSPVHAQGGLVFVCGSRDGLMQVSGRKHNTDDVIATVLAVEPMKFIYRGRQVELGRGPAGTPREIPLCSQDCSLLGQGASRRTHLRGG